MNLGYGIPKNPIPKPPLISGAAGGAHSLASHVGAAMVKSVTNMAGSLSRNVDSLALERSRSPTHSTRPTHFSQGLAQGLSHFGISMLGSVAGLVQVSFRKNAKKSFTLALGK